MSIKSERLENKRLMIGSIAVIIAVVLLLLFVSWILSRGIEDDTTDPVPMNVPSSSQAVPNQNNATDTGGMSAGGTDTGNDPTIGTPSPAGGVDTNGSPTGGNTPPSQ